MMRNLAVLLIFCISRSHGTTFVPLRGQMLYEKPHAHHGGDMSAEGGPSQANVDKMVMMVFMNPKKEEISIFMPDKPESETSPSRTRSLRQDIGMEVLRAANTEQHDGPNARIDSGYAQRSRKGYGLNTSSRPGHVDPRRSAADVYKKRSPASLLHKFHPASPDGAMDSCLPSHLLKVAKEIREIYTKFSPKMYTLYEINEEGKEAAEHTCPQIELRAFKECNPLAVYRSIDGSCNNLDNPLWGARLSPFVRFLPPHYEDGFNSMRGEGRGCTCKLPEPRDLSRNLLLLEPQKQKFNITMMVMQWGQFLDHDLTLTPVTPIENANFTCCDDGVPGEHDHPEDCRPLDYRGEVIFQKRKKTCARFVRSLIANDGFHIGESVKNYQPITNGSAMYIKSPLSEGVEKKAKIGLKQKPTTFWGRGGVCLTLIKSGVDCHSVNCSFDPRLERVKLKVQNPIHT
ncbi:unnamed protein product, partial [Meganyctiphanes norvegica]